MADNSRGEGCCSSEPIVRFASRALEALRVAPPAHTRDELALGASAFPTRQK
jgi:hypothetical protein